VQCFLGGLPGGISEDELAAMVPNWRLTHLFENVFPRLKELGMSQEDLDHIVTDNPRRYFTEAKASAG
jgi:phosphotriesterase-related protein